MRVLSVMSHGHLPQVMGGIQTVVDDLNHMLQAKGHTPAVLAGLVSSGGLYVWNRVKSKTPPRDPCPVDTLLGYSTYRGWDNVACAKHVVESFKPDIAIVHGPKPVHAAQAISDLGIPSIVYFHNLGLDDAALPKSPLISYVANSRFTAEWISERHGLQCPVVLPLMRLDRYICDRSPKVVTMVNPILSKGVATAIGLAQSRPDIQFLFVKAWQSLAGIEDTTILKDVAGKQPNITIMESVSDMRKVFRNTRILLMPTTTHIETYGRTAVEAQMSGIPVIARGVGGLAEAVGDGGILLAPSAALSDWVDAVSSLWDSDDTYRELSNRARAHAARVELEVLSAFDRLVRICEALIAGKGPDVTV